MKRGSYITLPDGRNILFIGGAQSLDKDAREPGINWFPGEVLMEEDVNDLPEIEIEIVISHTCPREFIPQVKAKDKRRFEDPSHDVLSKILNKYMPKYWYFGHFHSYQKGITENIKWTALNQIGDTGWFEKLPV